MAEMLRETDEAEETVFKKKLKKLKEFRGRGTEMISLYIPEKADRSQIMGQITQETGQSSNIKSPQTRKNVQGALRKIGSFLKNIDFKIPKKGLVVFSGNISEVEGRSDIRLFTMNPLFDLKTKLYWCDSSFHLVPLEEMIKPTEIYALMVIDKREATLAVLTGKKYEIVGHFTSAVAGKTRAGGQCLAPETIVALSDGRTLPIKNLHNPFSIKSANLSDFSLTDSKITKKWETAKEQVKVITKTPRIEIVSSPDHAFFVFNSEDQNVKEKIASELNEGDFLLRLNDSPEKNEPQLQPVQIARIKKSGKRIPMIDISVENKNFFANGLLVHNSSVRFEHLREEAAKDFFKRVSAKVNQLLVDYEDKLRGVIVGGPGMTKQDFLKQGALDYRLKDKILGTVDNSYTDESGIRELMQKSEEILKDTAITRERQIVNRFLEQAVVDGLATYGQKQTEEALSIGKAADVLVSEGINWEVIKLYCENCDKTEEKIVKEPEKFDESKERCSKCGGKVELLEEVDYLDWLVEKAHNTSAVVHVISQETPEGQTFFRGFGGIGAILRYK